MLKLVTQLFLLGRCIKKLVQNQDAVKQVAQKGYKIIKVGQRILV